MDPMRQADITRNTWNPDHCVDQPGRRRSCGTFATGVRFWNAMLDRVAAAGLIDL